MLKAAEDICNLALIELGADPITSLSEGSKSARVCKSLYPALRNDLLRSHLWNFAMRRATLAKLSTAPEFGFSAQFQLPSDFLRLVTIKGGRKEFQIEGQRILIDADSLQITYIARIENVGLMDSMFVEVLAAKLAAKMCYNITGNAFLAQDKQRLFEQKFARAKQIDAQENYNYSMQANAYTDARLRGVHSISTDLDYS